MIKSINRREKEMGYFSIASQRKSSEFSVKMGTLQKKADLDWPSLQQN
jgi:hypothetical protein